MRLIYVCMFTKQNETEYQYYLLASAVKLFEIE